MGRDIETMEVSNNGHAERGDYRQHKQGGNSKMA
jgi:hypothetical protein